MSESLLAYFKGQFVPVEQANVNIQCKALQYGLGCFEGIRAYWREEDEKLFIFRLRDHFKRLAISCRIIQMNIGVDVDEMVEITVELCRRSKFTSDVYIRPIAFSNSLCMSPIIPDEDNEFAVYAFPLRDYLDTSKGIRAIVSSWTRVADNMLPARAKPTAAYLNSALARQEAKAAGVDEAIFLTRNGYVSEGSAEHLFLVRDGAFITPTTQEDNLEGITQKTLVQLIREKLKRPVVERHVARTELYAADEAFFCGTGAEVTPVVEIDRRTVGDGRPGPLTMELQKVFFDVVKARVSEYADWCYPV